MPSLYGARELPLHRDCRPHSHDAALRAPPPLRLAWQTAPTTARPAPGPPGGGFGARCPLRLAGQEGLIMTRLAAWASGGGLVAWLGFVFGSVVSVLANVMDARLPPAGADASWTPPIEAQLAAAVWPLSLLLAVEAVGRGRRAEGWGWGAAPFGGGGAGALFSPGVSYLPIPGGLVGWGDE